MCSQQTRQLISTQKTSCRHSKDRSLTWHTSKYKVHKFICTSGGVNNVPFTYSHARWVTVGDSGLYCDCATSFELSLTPLLRDAQ